MKLIVIIFFLIAWYAMKAAILNDTAPNTIVFPTYTPPSADNFVDLSDGCGGFSECLEFIGYGLFDIVVGVIYVVTLIVGLQLFVAAIIVTIVTILFSGIDDAPVIVNLLLTVPLGAAVVLVLYKLIRSGSSEA